MDSALVAIDVGTSGARASAFKNVEQAVAAAYRPGPVAEPSLRLRGRYDDLYARYLALTKGG